MIECTFFNMSAVCRKSKIGRVESEIENIEEQTTNEEDVRVWN